VEAAAAGLAGLVVWGLHRDTPHLVSAEGVCLRRRRRRGLRRRRAWRGGAVDGAPDLGDWARTGRSILAGETLRRQPAFDDYLARRAADPSTHFRRHLRRIGAGPSRS